MKGYVVCKMSGTGSKSASGFLYPKLYNYMSNFEVKASTGATATSWCVCIVDNSTEIPATIAGGSDPNVLVFDTEAELDTVLTSQERNRVNNVLSQTTWGVTAVAGDTRRTVLGKIRAAVGDSIESWGLGV